MTDQKHLRSHSLSLSHTSKHMRTQAHSNLSLPHPHCLPHIHIHTLIHTHTLTLTRRHLRLTLTRVFWRCKLQTLKSIFTRECLDDPATPTAPAQHRTRPPPHTQPDNTPGKQRIARQKVFYRVVVSQKYVIHKGKVEIPHLFIEIRHTYTCTHTNCTLLIIVVSRAVEWLCDQPPLFTHCAFIYTQVCVCVCDVCFFFFCYHTNDHSYDANVV
jgi:hypothetical protein